MLSRALCVMEDDRVVTGSDDQTSRVWDASTGSCLQIFDGLRGRVAAVGLLPGGRVVTGSGFDVQIWNPNAGIFRQG